MILYLKGSCVFAAERLEWFERPCNLIQIMLAKGEKMKKIYLLLFLTLVSQTNIANSSAYPTDVGFKLVEIMGKPALNFYNALLTEPIETERGSVKTFPGVSCFINELKCQFMVNLESEVRWEDNDIPGGISRYRKLREWIEVRGKLALILRDVIAKDDKSVRFMFKSRFTSKGLKDVPIIEIIDGGFDVLYEYNLEKNN